MKNLPNIRYFNNMVCNLLGSNKDNHLSSFRKENNMKKISSIITMGFTLFCLISSASAASTTWYLTMTSTERVSHPFGIVQDSSKFYGSFTFDEDLLLVDGRYRNQLTDFNLTIGDSTWKYENILDNLFDVENGIVTNFFLDQCSLPNSDKYLEISDFDDGNGGLWYARDAYERPNPYMRGSYVIQKNAPLIDPVPEPATFILLGSGLAGLAFYRRKRK